MDRGGRSVHCVDDVSVRRRGSQCDHHAARLHVRSQVRVRDPPHVRYTYGLEYSPQGCWRQQRLRARQHDRHAGDADDHHADNPYGRHVVPRYVRTQVHGCVYD